MKERVNVEDLGVDEKIVFSFYVLLTVDLSIILVIKQLNAQMLVL